MRRSEPYCKDNPTPCSGTKRTSSGNTWTSISIRSRCSAVEDWNEPAMSVRSLPLPALSLSRRHVLISGAGAAAGLLLPSLAGAQTRLVIPEGNVAPLPIAIPDFVAGSPADGGGGGGGAPGLTKKPPPRGRFAAPPQYPLLPRKGNNDTAPPLPSREKN